MPNEQLEPHHPLPSLTLANISDIIDTILRKRKMIAKYVEALLKAFIVCAVWSLWRYVVSVGDWPHGEADDTMYKTCSFHWLTLWIQKVCRLRRCHVKFTRYPVYLHTPDNRL